MTNSMGETVGNEQEIPQQPEGTHPFDPNAYPPPQGEPTFAAGPLDSSETVQTPNAATPNQTPVQAGGFDPTQPVGYQPGYGQQPYGTPDGQQRTQYGYGQQPQQPYAQTYTYPQYTPQQYQQYYGQFYTGQDGQQQYSQQGQASGGQQYQQYYQPYGGQYANQYPQGQYQPYYRVPTTPKKAKKPWLGITAMVVAVGMFLAGTGMMVQSVLHPESEEQYPTSQQNPQYPQGQYPQGQQNDQGNAKQSSTVQVTAEQSKGVVMIVGKLSDTSEGAGTGMILSSDGKVLTNYHVVAGTTELSVEVADTGKTYTAKVLGYNAKVDVALLQLEGASGLETVTIDDDQVNVGDTISAVGNANGGGELVRADGTVTELKQNVSVDSSSPWGNEEDLEGVYETNAAAEPGDSGGPMFDAEAEVMGMTTAGSQQEGITYSVPIQDALTVVKQIESGVESGETQIGPAGYLGITVMSQTVRRGAEGIEVASVAKDGPAEKIGITAGSEIIEINGKKIEADTNLAGVLRVLNPGEKVKVTWIDTKGSEHTAEATLSASPVN
ncbi:MAG: trypsin-like peptidase domain-containing protein [Propionibacteriaceae bacterium]|nr:trypsin-like peptidase domain-containing protein [Propionibacteriaceae bacterium]